MSAEKPLNRSPFDISMKPEESRKYTDSHIMAVPEESSECCCYPCGGQDCLCLCKNGCPLSGHVVGRCVLLIFDLANAILSIMAGLMYIFLGNCDGSCETPRKQEKFKTGSITLCFLAFVCYLVAFCFSCVFLASLSWLEGARRDAAQRADPASSRQLHRYTRKDTNLNITLFSLNATGCVCSILAMAFCVEYVQANDFDMGNAAIIIVCMALSCVLVILQPIKQVVGQTLCAKH